MSTRITTDGTSLELPAKAPIFKNRFCLHGLSERYVL